MFNMNIDFFKSIYNDDVIYHYTKASTAIDYILYNNNLKFGGTRNSFDPIESRKAERGTVYYKTSINKSTSTQQYEDAEELHAYLDDIESRFNLVYFCQNNFEIDYARDFASEHYNTHFEGKEELFGFTKLRMWDQYADRFSGVCIAFSKEKILSLNCKHFDLMEGCVKYLKFHELSINKVGDIQGDHLSNVGKEEYKALLEKKVKESFFYKHIDYSGENEYRIGTLFDKGKCSFELIRDEMVFDRTMMLDITGCVKAIFVSSYANEKQKRELLHYAIKNGIELIEMRWQHNSFEPIDYKKWIAFVNSFEPEKRLK